MDEHWYYLHTNGSLIYKRIWPGGDNSPFVRRIWPCDPSDRANAWTILIEATALGADIGRIRELASKWKCDARDLVEYMHRIPYPTGEQREGMRLFIERVLLVDADVFYDWLAGTPKGETPDFASMPPQTSAMAKAKP